MLNKQKSQNSRKSGLPFFYGWIIVFVSALGFFFSGPGQTYSVSVFIDSFISYLGLTRSVVSIYYSTGTLLAGLGVVFVSRQIDKIGHRKMITIVALAFGGVCLFMSFIIHPAMLFIGFFLIRLIGQSLMTIGPSTLVPRWFEKKRGRALSLMSIGGIIAAALLPVLNTWMINNWGWRMGWRFWAVSIWAVMVPLAWFLIRDNPKDIGLTSDGTISDPSSDSETMGGKNNQGVKYLHSMTLNEARQTLSFWLLLLCMFTPSMIITGITFHIVSIFSDSGLSAQVAALTLSIMAITSLPSVLLAGFLLDKIKIRYVLIAIHLFFFITLIWLLNVNTLQKAIAYGLLQGSMLGFQQVMINTVWPSYFGLRHLSSIRGVVQASMVIGSAFGPLFFGFAYDFFGGYKEILWIMILFSALTVVATFLSRPPVKKENLNL